MPVKTSQTIFSAILSILATLLLRPALEGEPEVVWKLPGSGSRKAAKLTCIGWVEKLISWVIGSKQKPDNPSLPLAINLEDDLEWLFYPVCEKVSKANSSIKRSTNQVSLERHSRSTPISETSLCLQYQFWDRLLDP